MPKYSVRIVHPKHPKCLDYDLNATTGPKARKEAALLVAGRGEGAIITLSRVNENGIHIPLTVGLRRANSTRWKRPVA